MIPPLRRDRSLPSSGPAPRDRVPPLREPETPPAGASLASSRERDGSGAWKGLLLPALALALGAYSLGIALGRDHALDASTAGAPAADTDGDGLIDHVESILGTDELLPDTDGDGYSDYEEFARQSDPCGMLSVPGLAPVTAGLTARVDQSGLLHVILLLYLHGGSLAGVDLEFGFGLFGQAQELPPAVYLPSSTIAFEAPGLTTPGAVVMRLELLVPANLVISTGALSFYALTGAPFSPTPTIATTTNLVAGAGEVVMVQDDPGVSSTSGEADTVYKPLAPGGGIPPNWEPGKYCAQNSIVTGASGGFITKTVVSAQCKDADALCMPGCATLVGTNIDCLDGPSLLGG